MNCSRSVSYTVFTNHSGQDRPTIHHYMQPANKVSFTASSPGGRDRVLDQRTTWRWHGHKTSFAYTVSSSFIKYNNSFNPETTKTPSDSASSLCFRQQSVNPHLPLGRKLHDLFWIPLVGRKSSSRSRSRSRPSSPRKSLLFRATRFCRAVPCTRVHSVHCSVHRSVPR